MYARRRIARRIGMIVPVVAMALLGSGGTAFTAASRAGSSPTAISLFASPSPIIVNLDTNWYTKYVEKQYNLKITWNLVPGSDLATKETVLLESGNYPDVFFSASFTAAQVLKYAQQGIFVPIDGLIKQYAPNVWHGLQTEPGLKQSLTAPDGHIYGLPAYNVCIHCDYAAKYWINTQKLRQYGLQVPKTTADFEHVLQVFKQHGLIPLSGAVEGGSTGGWHSSPVTFLMNSFIYDDGSPTYQGGYFTIDNGKVAFAPIQPQWKAGLAYLHRLYGEGLIDPGAFSQLNSALQKDVANGRVGVVPWGCIECVDPNYANEVTSWHTIAPLTGPSGVHYAAFFGNSPGFPIVFAITNKATKPQEIAMMKLLNDMWTVNGFATEQFGPSGDGIWTKTVPAGAKGMDGKPAIFTVNTEKINSPGVTENWSWYLMGPFFQPYAVRYGQVAKPPYAAGGVGAESMLQLETEENYVGLQPRYVVPGALWIDPSSAQQYTLLQTNITNFVTQWADQFIVGTKSLDSDWNSYVQGIQNLGLMQYLQLTQKAMGKPMDTSGFPFQKDMQEIRFLQSLK